MRYLYGHDGEVADFVAQLIPSCRSRGFGNCKAIGVIDKEGRLIAGIVYHNYDPDAEIIEISAAALPKQNWLTRETLRHMYQYPFLQCRCQMVVQRVPLDDERQLRMMAVFGFTLIKVIHMLGRDRDGVIGTLTFEDWRDNRFNRKLEMTDEQPTERAA